MNEHDMRFGNLCVVFMILLVLEPTRTLLMACNYINVLIICKNGRNCMVGIRVGAEIWARTQILYAPPSSA